MEDNILTLDRIILFVQALILGFQLILMWNMHKYSKKQNRANEHKIRILEIISKTMIDKQAWNVNFLEIHNELNNQYPKEKYTKYETYALLGVLKSEDVVFNTRGENVDNKDPDLYTTAHRFLTRPNEIPSSDDPHNTQNH